MNVRDHILDMFGEEAEGIMFADGFDSAIVGVGKTFGGMLCAVYNTDEIIRILMRDGMHHDEAYEYFEFNIAGAYVGDQTPIFMHPVSVK